MQNQTRYVAGNVDNIQRINHNQQVYALRHNILQREPRKMGISNSMDLKAAKYREYRPDLLYRDKSSSTSHYNMYMSAHQKK